MREGLNKLVSMEETIVAISTPPGRSGIGVVRLSGHECTGIAQRFFRSSSHLEHRRALPGTWYDARGERIDDVVVTLFRSPRSYTGEDVVEVSAHGNPFVMRQIVASLRSGGARLATPGEFTLRAVANGKMDLIQAEAVREFIAAQTQQQARIALRQMEGALSRYVRPIREGLIDAVARLEAGIDFAEDDVDVPSNESVRNQVLPLIAALAQLQGTFSYGKMLAEGLRLAILGKPNVGKSSLFNRLVESDRAIVTEIPGTTRDVLTETIDMGGVPVRFADTAGVHATMDRVERIGVSRSLEELADADLALVIVDGSAELDEDDRHILGRARAVPHLVVINKHDLPQRVDTGGFNGMHPVHVSAKTGLGLDDLRNAIRGFFLDGKTDLADDVVLTSVRQNEAILRAIAVLEASTRALEENVPHEMVLLDLYEALGALGDLTGETVTEDILDRIFSTFCIGK